MGIILRWACALLLLAATFNPTEYNYVHWVRSNGAENLSIAVLAGLVLGIGYIIYLRATLRSIGAFGMLLVLAVVGAVLGCFMILRCCSLTIPASIFGLD